MIIKLPQSLLEVLPEFKMLPYEFLELEGKLSDKELELLEIILYKHTLAEYRLYIKEMCNKLKSRGALPPEFLWIIGSK